MTINTLPTAVQFKDFTTASLSAGATTTLRQANMMRNGLQFQCPQSDIWYSYTNSSPSANGSGCYYLAAGQTYGPATCVPGNAVYVYSVAGGIVVCSES